MCSPSSDYCVFLWLCLFRGPDLVLAFPYMWYQGLSCRCSSGRREARTLLSPATSSNSSGRMHFPMQLRNVISLVLPGPWHRWARREHLPWEKSGRRFSSAGAFQRGGAAAWHWAPSGRLLHDGPHTPHWILLLSLPGTADETDANLFQVHTFYLKSEVSIAWRRSLP